MQCDCKDKFHDAVKSHIMLKAPEGSAGFEIELKGYGMTFAEDGVKWIFKVDVGGQYMAPKKAGGFRKQKVNTFIAANYCPFCGVKCKPDGVIEDAA